ncbi:hypothetical protein AAG570_002712 [Ranatra chinensis]|uniref:Fatty acid desaturase domain-containing protein n=1 Tax=Ranatra chinensis TaxID=642074 RepID=A0ABD0Y8S0_9HEMI
MWSHRAFKAITPLKIVLLIGQTIAGQNCLWVWVRDHRQHHRHSDTHGDPHNASNGFFFSHIGWLMSKKHPEVIAKGKLIDMSDLEADPWVMFQKDHYKKLYFLFAFLVPVLVPIVCWDETVFNSVMVAFFARAIITINGTWMVNSWAHKFGTRPFTRDILPTDTHLVALIALGEGWHNYHHTFPWDYRAAEAGSPLNLTRRLIEGMAAWGWVYDLKAATPGMVKARVLAKGDGSHPLWGHSTFEEFQQHENR